MSRLFDAEKKMKKISKIQNIDLLIISLDSSNICY